MVTNPDLWEVRKESLWKCDLKLHLGFTNPEINTFNLLFSVWSTTFSRESAVLYIGNNIPNLAANILVFCNTSLILHMNRNLPGKVSIRIWIFLFLEFLETYRNYITAGIIYNKNSDHIYVDLFLNKCYRYLKEII